MKKPVHPVWDYGDHGEPTAPVPIENLLRDVRAFRAEPVLRNWVPPDLIAQSARAAGLTKLPDELASYLSDVERGIVTRPTRGRPPYNDDGFLEPYKYYVRLMPLMEEAGQKKRDKWADILSLDIRYDRTAANLALVRTIDMHGLEMDVGRLANTFSRLRKAGKLPS